MVKMFLFFWQSVVTALAVIYAAKKYMVNRIDTLALRFISKNINSENVLMVLQHLLLLAPPPPALTCSLAQHSFAPSAPALELLDQEDCPATEEPYFSYQFPAPRLDTKAEKVMKRCYALLDREAGRVLGSDDWEDLSLELVREILARDSLQVESELVVLEAVDRWAHRQCRRRHLQPSPDNKRAVLGGAQYQVRWLTLTSDQLRTAQVRARLLTEEEEIHVLFSILHLGSVLPADMRQFKWDMRRVRRGKRGWRKICWIRRKAGRRSGSLVEQEGSECGLGSSLGQRKLSLAEVVFVFIGKLFD